MALIKAIGFFVTAMGILILLNPGIAKKMMVFWRQGKHIYIGGVIRVLLGISFISYSSQARLPWVMFALGVLALLGGLFIFILGAEKAKVMLGWLDKKPEKSMRLLSLLVLAFGALIIYSV